MKLTWSKIKKGDTVGIITPSRHIFGISKNIQKSLTILQKAGLEIQLGDCFKKRLGSNSGTRYERAAEINQMFADKKIKAIFCSIGGDACNQILDLLDYKNITKNPKPIIGYSDITNLLLAIKAKTGIRTFHGPNLNILPKLTSETFAQLMFSINGESSLENYFSWGKVLKPGKTHGKLIGGNLMIINSLKSTAYLPNLDGSILFWEDIDEGNSAIEYQIYQLYNAGVLKKIHGMIIGNISKSNTKKDNLYRETILHLTKKYDYPIWKTNCFGHEVKKFLTFPIGAEIILNTERKTLNWR